MTCHLQGILNEIVSTFLITQGRHTQSTEKKPFQPKILYMANLSFKSAGEINTFLNKTTTRTLGRDQPCDTCRCRTDARSVAPLPAPGTPARRQL